MLRIAGKPDVFVNQPRSHMTTNTPTRALITEPQVIWTDVLPTAVIHLTVPGSDMPKYMDPAIQEVLKVLADQGQHPAGPMFSYHHRRPSETFDFELGSPVVKAIAPVGRVVNSALPREKVARCVYQGPYEGLAQAWPELDRWVREMEMEGSGRFWERYLNNPDEVTDPAEYRTELNWVLVD